MNLISVHVWIPLSALAGQKFLGSYNHVWIFLYVSFPSLSTNLSCYLHLLSLH